MSLFSNSVKVVTTATPNFTVESYEGPNVGQYGWTKADTGHFNQLIQYVEECRSILEQVKEIQGGLPTILVYLDEIRKTHDEIMATQKEIEASLVVFETNYRDFMTRYAEFSATYIAFQNQYVDFLNKGKEIIDEAARFSELSRQYSESSKAYSLESKAFSLDSKNYSVVSQNHSLESLSYANTSKTHADTSLSHALESSGFADISESWYKKSEELYEELRKGQVYRGAWNPHSGAWPANGGTNSVWDVVLNEGDDSFVWNSITWRWGDRLVYIKDSNSYQQISSGKGVLSVNGKTGSVSLSATDVGALPSTGGTLSGNLTVNGTIESTADFGISTITADGGTVGIRFIKGVPSIRYGGAGPGSIAGFQVVGVGDSVKFKVDNGGELFAKGTSKVYHQGFKPTLSELGAAPSGYGLGEFFPPRVNNLDDLRNNGWSEYNVDAGQSGGPIPYGNVLYSGSPGNGQTFAGWCNQLFFGTEGQIFTRVNKNKGSFSGTPWDQVYTTRHKPSASDVGALPLTGGSLSGMLTVNSGITVNEGSGSHKQLIFTSDKYAMFGAFDGRFINYLDQDNMTAWVWRATVNGTGVSDKMILTRAGDLSVAGNLSTAIGTFGNKVQSNEYWSRSSNRRVIATEAESGAGIYWGNTEQWSRVHCKSGLLQASDGSNIWRVYHQGYKPSASDVGALPSTGGTVDGNLNIGSNHRLETDPNIATYNSKNPNGWRLYMGGTGGAGEVLTVNNTSGIISAKKKFQAEGQILTKAPSVTATSLSHLTGNDVDSPILVRNVQTPKVAISYAEMLHGSCQVAELGYKGHLSIGAKRSNTLDWGSAYIAYGGSDGYPTKEWLFQSTTGNFISSGSLVSTAEHPIKTNGGILRANRDDVLSLDGSKYAFVVSPQDAHLCTNSYFDGAWKKHDTGNNAWTLVVKPNETPHFMYSPAGNTNPYLTKYKIYHEGNKPTAEEVGAASGGYAYAFPGGNDVNQNLRTSSGFFNASSATNRPSWPMGGAHTWDYYYNAAHANSSGYNGVIAMDFNGQGLAFKAISAGADKGWKYVYHTGFKPSAADIGAVGLSNKTVVIPAFSGTSNATIKTQHDKSGGADDKESWLTDKPDTVPGHKAIGIKSTAGPVYWNGSALKRIYNEDFKPTAADVGAVSKSGDTINGNLTINYGMDGVQHIVFNNNLNAMMGTYIKRFISYLDQDNMTAWAWRTTSGSLGVADKMVLTKEGNLSVDGEIYTSGSFKTSGSLTLINNVRSLQLQAEDTAGGICYFNINNSAVRPLEFFDEGFVRVNPQQGKGVDRIRTGRTDIWNQFHAGGIAAFTYGINSGDNFAINQSDGSFTWTRTLMTINAVSGDMQLSHAGYANNGFHTGSDLRFKEKVKPLSRLGGSWLDKVCSLGASSYVYKDKPEAPRLGFIAQEVQEVIPDAVSVQKVTHPDAVDTADLVERMFLDPMAIIAAQNEAIKELVGKFNALEERLKVLEGLN